MSSIRIIAVEKNFSTSENETEPCIACAFKQDKLYVYDTLGDLYFQKEFFYNFDNLIYLINKDKYEWTDFYINKGEIITRDSFSNIIVNSKIIKEPIAPLNNKSNRINDNSLKLFYKFLCKINKDNPAIYTQLTSSFESGEFKDDIINIVKDNPINKLKTEDLELVVRSRLKGYDFISDKFISFIKSKDPYKIDQIIYYFTRLFKLEYGNYI